MKMRMVIIAACAGTFALVQTGLVQPAYAGGWPMGCGPGTFYASYTNAYGRHVMKCVSRDYYRVQNSGAYTNPPPQPWRERKRW
jgi:hypothetical protein